MSMVCVCRDHMCMEHVMAIGNDRDVYMSVRLHLASDHMVI